MFITRGGVAKLLGYYMVVILGLAGIGGKVAGAAAVLNALYFVLALYLVLPIVALARSGTGRLVGFRLFAIHLSASPTRQRIIAGVPVVLGRAPFGAQAVLAGRSASWLRPRIVLTAATDVAAYVALCVGALALGGGARALLDVPASSAPAGAAAIACGFLAITSAVQVNALARAPRAALAGWSDAYHAYEGARLMALGRYDDALSPLKMAVDRTSTDHSRYVLGECLMWLGRYAEACDLMRCGLRLSFSAKLRALVLNNTAWCQFMAGDAGLLDEAERLSAEALALDAVNPSVRGTRGAVLVARGEIDAAIPLLEYALAENPLAKSRAYNACCLAMAMLARGDTPAAARYLAMARELWAECPLLVRAPLPDARAFARVPGRVPDAT